MEKWININGFEELYQISNTGEAKSFDRLVVHKTGFKQNRLGIIKSKQISHKGYYTVSLSKNGKSKRIPIHRLVAINFIPNPENKKQVNHKDGNKLNNNDWNLEWATNSENQLHAYKTGLQKPHKANVKLSIEQVLEIREKYSTGNFSQKDLAKEYGRHKSTIQAVISGRNWSDV